MKVDTHELRHGMAARSHDELEEIVANARGFYTATAVDTARVELASRPPRIEAEEVSAARLLRLRYFTPGDLVPLGVRISLWLALAYGIGSILALIISVILVTAGAVPTQGALEFVRYSGISAISWWIVLAIKRRYAYGRTLLTAVAGTWILYSLALDAVQIVWSELLTIPIDPSALWRFAINQHAAEPSTLGNGVIVPGLALCYFVLNRNVASYFRARSPETAAQQGATAG